jgi:restriction system protein
MTSSANAPALTGAALYVPKIVAVLRELGGKGKTSVVRSTIVDEMSAKGEEIDETEVSGEPKYQNDMRFARLHLVNAGKLEPMDISGRGYWQLTAAGWDMPLDNATALSVCGKGSLASAGPAQLQEPTQDELPGVALGDLALRNVLLSLSDIGFERLCAAIMTANDAEAITVTGKAGDGGIDGTATFAVDSLALVSFRVAWQCKKYASGNKVQPAEIREFRGALDHGFQHGIFFTTSTFTIKAEEEARRPGQVPIQLVDISRLIELLKTKGLGVSPGLSMVDEQAYAIDHAYFEKFKAKGLSGWDGKTLFGAAG